MKIASLPPSPPPISPNEVDAKSSSSPPSPSPLNIQPAQVIEIEDEDKSSDFPSTSFVVGAGLRNIANTCYLNSVLQCIVHTVPMVEKLRTSDHQHTNSEDDSDFCSLCALKNLYDLCITRSEGCVWPLDFTSNLRKISSDFLLGQQEDAHEFLHCLLDHLHNCCLDPSSKGHPSSMEKDSLIKHVYGGRSISQLQCSECGHCSNTPEPLLDLSLEITDADTLNDALMSFTRVEKIEEKLTCQGCKAQVLMEKQTKIEQAPTVISLHLKRFRNDAQSITKIDKFVEYPLELDLRPFIHSPKDEDQTMYDLYAILVHRGIASYGHYYCCIRSSPMTWHLMDDATVRSLSETEALKEGAYILFYIKQDSSPWFYSLMEDAQKLKDSSPISVLDQNPFPSSAEETSSSSSRETPEKDEEPVTDHQEQTHSPSTSHMYDDNYFKPYNTVMNHRIYSQPTRRLNSEQLAINISDVFHDEQLEDEEENDLILKPKGNKEEKKTAIEPRKEVCQLNAPLKRLVKAMPSSRRSQFLACIAPEKTENSSQFSKTEPLMKKRKREVSNPSLSECKEGCNKTSSRFPIPPIMRNLFSRD